MAGGGIGVLYGKRALLKQIAPAFSGGGMLQDLTGAEFQYAELPERWAGCLSFTVGGMSAQDAAAALNLRGMAVRSGHHCAIPAHRTLGIPASVRVSPAFYNTAKELRSFLRAMEEISSMCFRGV
jgi:cysteine desulfurase/selenocysteine lyase